MRHRNMNEAMHENKVLRTKALNAMNSKGLY